MAGEPAAGDGGDMTLWEESKNLRKEKSPPRPPGPGDRGAPPSPPEVRPLRPVRPEQDLEEVLRGSFADPPPTSGLPDRVRRAHAEAAVLAVAEALTRIARDSGGIGLEDGYRIAEAVLTAEDRSRTEYVLLLRSEGRTLVLGTFPGYRSALRAAQREGLPHRGSLTVEPLVPYPKRVPGKRGPKSGARPRKGGSR